MGSSSHCGKTAFPCRDLLRQPRINRATCEAISEVASDGNRSNHSSLSVRIQLGSSPRMGRPSSVYSESRRTPFSTSVLASSRKPLEINVRPQQISGQMNLVSRQLEQDDRRPANVGIVPIRETVREQDNLSVNLLANAPVLSEPIDQGVSPKTGKRRWRIDSHRW